MLTRPLARAILLPLHLMMRVLGGGSMSARSKLLTSAMLHVTGTISSILG